MGIKAVRGVRRKQRLSQCAGAEAVAVAEDAELAVKFFRDAKLKPETVSVCWGGGGGGGRGGAAQCTVSTYDGHRGQPMFPI